MVTSPPASTSRGEASTEQARSPCTFTVFAIVAVDIANAIAERVVSQTDRSCAAWVPAM